MAKKLATMVERGEGQIVCSWGRGVVTWGWGGDGGPLARWAPPF